MKLGLIREGAFGWRGLIRRGPLYLIYIFAHFKSPYVLYRYYFRVIGVHV
jgi:hypothetical protein